MGKATEFIVTIHDEGDGSSSDYGPYSLKQAEEVVRKIERWIARDKVDADRDEDGYTVTWGKLGRWAAPQNRIIAPRRPTCPACGFKMKVWESDYANEAFANCPSKECEYARSDVRVEIRNGRWTISENDSD